MLAHSLSDAVTDRTVMITGASQGIGKAAALEIGKAGGDVLLLVGDTAHADGDALEQALSRFEFRGPKLFVAGNAYAGGHETRFAVVRYGNVMGSRGS